MHENENFIDITLHSKVPYNFGKYDKILLIDVKYYKITKHVTQLLHFLYI